MALGDYKDGVGGSVYHSYAGCDIRAVAFDASMQKMVELANIQTITFSIHREKFPVRSLGNTHAKAHTRGPRTIAGSIIFTVFNQEVLGEFLGLSQVEVNAGQLLPITVDQIPPFHVVLLFASELNYLSTMAIYNIDIINEGQVMSIEDLITENTCQYLATHIEPMRPIADKSMSNISFKGTTFRDLLTQPLYSELLSARNPFDNQVKSNNLLSTVNTLTGGNSMNA